MLPEKMSQLAGNENQQNQPDGVPHPASGGPLCSERGFRGKALPAKVGRQSQGLVVVVGDRNAVISQKSFQRLNTFQAAWIHPALPFRYKAGRMKRIR